MVDLTVAWNDNRDFWLTACRPQGNRARSDVAQVRPRDCRQRATMWGLEANRLWSAGPRRCILSRRVGSLLLLDPQSRTDLVLEDPQNWDFNPQVVDPSN